MPRGSLEPLHSSYFQKSRGSINCFIKCHVSYIRINAWIANTRHQYSIGNPPRHQQFLQVLICFANGWRMKAARAGMLWTHLLTATTKRFGSPGLCTCLAGVLFQPKSTPLIKLHQSSSGIRPLHKTYRVFCKSVMVSAPTTTLIERSVP